MSALSWQHRIVAAAASIRPAIICVVAAFAVSGIGGCQSSDTPAARFADYLERLSRVLDQPLPYASDNQPLAYPAKRLLHLEVETPRTGWIGFAQLHRCGLVNLVSERNSILGRVAPPQRRLAYESRLLARLKRCRAELADTADAEFVARLDKLIAIKQRAVPRIFWNLSLGNNILAGVFSLAGDAPGLNPEAAGQAARRAVAELGRAGKHLAEGRILAADTLTPIYQTLETSAYGGRLLRAAMDASATLERAAVLIESRLTRRPVCFNQRPNRRARRLQTVLLDIYGQRIQPYLAALDRAGERWRQVMTGLIDVQHVPLPRAFDRYRRLTLADNSGVWARLEHALSRHTELWQRLMRQCDLMPGG